MNASSLMHPGDERLKAVLGPTNTGKTHLAIERMCAHSSGAMGFPLRLLAREVYERVCAIKGPGQVALITGEERIEPPDARWLLCTAEAMPRDGGGRAFVALDEAQLAADRDRGHIFTDRLLHTRGREETMLLGAATLAPVIKALLPEAEITERPRFSTLAHAGSSKLSRLPPRSAIVAFSAEQVYTVAEMLRRYRGGAAVVMGALSPQARNAQVEMFQSGEVDYIVATDAIGMGLNLDIVHVAFASLSKYDGVRQRRLTAPEMAQIAGRAGRHQRDGTFGTLHHDRDGSPLALTEVEVEAIENHTFAPLSQLFWRDGNPRCTDLASLVADLEAKPDDPRLAPAPEAIDLAVLKRLADDPVIAGSVDTPRRVARFWETCSLPDFRQHGSETHARFVARLWSDLRNGPISAQYAAARIVDLDRTQGDIDTLQARIAAIRSWAYIAQRPDWLKNRSELAERAKAVEARLSQALHDRLTERFVNRRTSVLMKTLAKDPALLRVALEDDGVVTVEGQALGHLEGFRFIVDKDADRADRKLLLAAAERHLPELLAREAGKLAEGGLDELRLEDGRIFRGVGLLAQLEPGKSRARPRLVLASELADLAPRDRARLSHVIALWLESELAPLKPLETIEAAARDSGVPAEMRALLIALAEGCGTISRETAGLEFLAKEHRPKLRRLGIVIGALDVFIPAMLKPAPRRLLHAIGADRRPVEPQMPPVIDAPRVMPAGYRRVGKQAIRIDLAEKLLRAAHDGQARAGGRAMPIDNALATSMGLSAPALATLLREGGFRAVPAPSLAKGAHGPPAPHRWRWKPRRRRMPKRSPRADRQAAHSPFAALAELSRPPGAR